MQLPFTREQFFDLFAAYNAALWPALVVLWMASVVVSALLLSSRRPPDRWIAALLAAHWIWSAVAYHAVFFTRINPAAWLFAALFLLQAALFIWWGVVQRRLSFAPRRSGWARVGWVVDGTAAGFAEYGTGILDPAACRRLTETARVTLERWGGLLEERRVSGFVRQCHGDLHLRNIVLVDGRPTLFDGVEFNDEIACTDVLYDFAFLLMDLWRRGLPRHANVA